MPSTKEIRNRIKAVKNTAQITRAMQLVAASKMKRAQDRAVAGRTYAILLAEAFSALAKAEISMKHPLLERRAVIKKRGILIVSTDKGLCGALNANLFKQVIAIKDTAAYVTIGRKATQFISRTQRELIADFPLTDHVGHAEVRTIVEFMLKLFMDGEIDTIEVLYSGFVNTLMQEPRLRTVVPIAGLEEALAQIKRRFKLDLADTSGDEREFIFEPSAEALLEVLPALFAKVIVSQFMLEAKASEHSARMVAMKAATDNAKNLTDDLTLVYNKARQAAITQEILEISAAQGN